MAAEGARQMYAQQALAFGVAAAFAPSKTDSTPDEPPKTILPSLDELAQAKRQAIATLPTHCVHCSTAYVKSTGSESSYVERDSGQLFCYDWKGCGKSYIHFTLPKGCRDEPCYKKGCVWNPPLRSATAAITEAAPQQQQQQQQLQPQVDVYALHGIDPPGTKCQTCDKERDEHKMDVDQNGWYVDRVIERPLPPNWPTWDSARGWWSNTE